MAKKHPTKQNKKPTISICLTLSSFLSDPADKESWLLAKAKLGIPPLYSFRIHHSLIHLPVREPSYLLLALSIGTFRLHAPTATLICFSLEPRKNSPQSLLSFLASSLFSSPPQLSFCCPSDTAQMKGTRLLQNRPFWLLSWDWLSVLLMLPPPSWGESP